MSLSASFSVKRSNGFSQRPLRIGYLPLIDSAPLVVAHSLGFFEQEGLKTTLCRQPGWACVRDKMLYGEIDAAHAPAGLLFAINAGATPNVGRCLTAFVMSAQGNAIVLSNRLAELGVKDRAGFHAEVRRQPKGNVTLGIVSRHSSHAHLLKGWLSEGGLDPESDVRIVVLPPQQMVISLSAGHIDGFCAGEPWNTLAVSERSGWIAADSRALAPMHPEKVLLVHEDFAQQHHADHMSLLRAQETACAWCADERNHRALVKLLARWVCVGLSEKVLLRSLSSPLAPVFTAPNLHAPTRDKASWVLGELKRYKLLPAHIDEAKLLTNFRMDLYQSMRETSVTEELRNTKRHEKRLTKLKVE